jgi:dienelactone hydrolase
MALLLVVAACDANSTAAPRMVIGQASELVDTAPSVRILGLKPAVPVTLRAQTPTRSGITWSSEATFQPGADGGVDLSRASARTGSSYVGVDPLGMFWSLAPHGHGTLSEPAAPPDPELITLTAKQTGSMAATRGLVRLTIGPGVTERGLTVVKDGLYGRLYTPPAGKAKKPAVLVFGGSEGGLATTLEASLLASHGYPALALAYFAEPGLPSNLQSVPLEYFANALTWLAGQPAVDGKHMAVLGASRGTEAALLLGVHFPQLVSAVIAYSPSSVANPGLSAATAGGPAWTLGGQPVPTVTLGEYGHPSPSVDTEAIIPVEQIRGPVLLISGADDQLWPSPGYAAAIMGRLDAAHDPYVHQSLVYPGAGHAVASVVPGQPRVGATATTRYGQLSLGGSSSANARAIEDSWPRVLAFLYASAGGAGQG